jgi:hypothetical protein
MVLLRDGDGDGGRYRGDVVLEAAPVMLAKREQQPQH